MTKNPVWFRLIRVKHKKTNMLTGSTFLISLSTFIPALMTGLFLFTVLVGVWVAYDRTIAWFRFGLITGGVIAATGVAWIGQRGGERILSIIGLICAVMAAAIGAYFLLTYDWTTTKHVKFAVIQQLGLWWQIYRPRLYVQELNPNLIAGGLVLMLPLGIGGVVWAWTRHYWWPAIVGTVDLGVGLMALVLTTSRGAWLGLSAGVLIAGYLEWRNYLPRWPLLRRLGDGLLIVVWLVVLISFGLILTWPNLEQWLDTLPRGATAISRLKFWRDSLTLIGDYPFTGSGLGNTVMVFSSYVLLLNVGFIDQHVHNLFLQIAVEQGLPGLLAFLGLLGLITWELVHWYRRGDGTDVLRWAATAAVIALLVQGMGEAGNYNGPPVLIGFLPLGFALGGARQRTLQTRQVVSPTCARHAWLVRSAWGVGASFLLTIILLPASRAVFQANLGAVAQTRAELSLYRWPEWPIQDAVRRASPVSLAPAIIHYRAALALDPANAAANRRLGQIELSLGRYQSARQHLVAAYTAAPGQRATRQLLGEAYALEGDIERAAALWRTIEVSQGQLELRQDWYTGLGESQQGHRIAEAAARLTAQ